MARTPALTGSLDGIDSLAVLLMSVCGVCQVGCAVLSTVSHVCTSDNYWDCLDSGMPSLSPARAVNYVWVLGTREAQEG
jgi:hypothetical protein